MLFNAATGLSRFSQFRHVAESWFKQALELDPACYEARHNYAVLLAEWPGRRADALHLFESAIERFPEDGELRFAFGSFLSRSPKSWKAAEIQFEAALSINSRHFPTLYNYAGLLLRQPEKWQHACDLYERAVELEPDNADVLHNLGKVYRRLRINRDKTAALFERALPLRTDLLFRWFLDLQPSDQVFDHAVFSHNRERLSEHGITQKFFDTVVDLPPVHVPESIRELRRKCPAAGTTGAERRAVRQRGAAVLGLSLTLVRKPGHGLVTRHFDDESARETEHDTRTRRISGRGIIATMRAGIVRWMFYVAAMMVVGPLAAGLLSGLRAADGSPAATPLASTAPVGGMLRGLLAMAIALGFGAAASRVSGMHAGLTTAGLVMAWVAWRSGEVHELIREAHSAGPLTRLSIEGAIFGAAGVLMACVLVLAAKGEGTARQRLLGSGRGTVVACAIGLAAGALAAWLVAVTPLKGQAVMAAVAAGAAAAAAARLADIRVPLAPVAVPLAVLAVLGPVAGLVLSGSGNVVAASYQGALAPIAQITPLDWIAGALLGIPLGAGWAGSMIEKRAAA